MCTRGSNPAPARGPSTSPLDVRAFRVTAAGKDFARQTAVDLAGAMLRGDVSLFLGCRRLADLAHQIVPDWTEDADFVVFGGVADEVDDLPVGTERARWSLSALRREDAKIAQYESKVRDQVLAACRNVLTRFSSSAPDV